jgi:hypothetical protein
MTPSLSPLTPAPDAAPLAALRAASPIDERTITRFWSKVDTSGECWEWHGAVSNHGYGQFKLAKRIVPAHRAAWLLTHGAISDGLFVCHQCDNRRCVNPSHLFLGTHSDNMRDAIAKGRVSRVQRRDGLAPDTVRSIRRLFDLGTPKKAIARRFGIYPSTVRDILNGKTYRHVQ